MTYNRHDIERLAEQVAEKKRLQAEIASLDKQKTQLTEKLRELDRIRYHEQADVERLEGRSLANFFYRVIGNMDERLTREKEQAYAAGVKYDAAARELEAVENEIRERRKQMLDLHNCEYRYEQALNARLAAVKAADTPEAAEILRLESLILHLETQKKEIGEALSAGRRARMLAADVLKELGTASGFSTWDMLGGGLIADLAKHSYLDSAQSMVEQLQVELRRFKTELSDVTIQANLHVSTDGVLRFADYFFDNLFTDWAVRDQIDRSKSEVQRTKQQIEQMLLKLEDMLRTAERQQAHAREQIDEIVKGE